MSGTADGNRSEANPAPARGLLRLSKAFGRDAAKSAEDTEWRGVERAAARGLGRAGHWVDSRNPDGMRRLTGSRAAVAGGVGLALLLVVVTVRRAARSRSGV
jgi:hypothetical protein